MTWVAVLAPVGVFVMVGVSWLLGGWRTGRLADPDAALAAFRQDYPDFGATDRVVAVDGAAALFAGDEPALGAVFALGDAFVTRTLWPGDVRRCDVAPRPDGTVRLTIRTADLTAPKLALTLPAAEAEHWRERVAALAGAG